MSKLFFEFTIPPLNRKNYGTILNSIFSELLKDLAFSLKASRVLEVTKM